MNIDKRLVLISFAALMLCGCPAAIIPAVGTVAIINEDRRTLGVLVEDQSIEQRAGGIISADSELKANSRINVVSYERMVLLTGEVTTEELRQRVVDIVRNVREVVHVYDQLTIAEPIAWTKRSGDALIATKVKVQLLKAEDVSGLHVKVVVDKGVVYLMGLVTEHEATVATEITRQVSGVQKVVQIFKYINEAEANLHRERLAQTS
jgi:osmotically-inducible protein OsmY